MGDDQNFHCMKDIRFHPHVFSTLLGTLDNKAIIVPNENMKKRFDAEGIQAPVPRRDVHLHQA